MVHVVEVRRDRCMWGGWLPTYYNTIAIIVIFALALWRTAIVTYDYGIIITNSITVYTNIGREF